MRICSLVPGATEVVVGLGFRDALVGISHECDYPESVRGIPVLVHPVVDSETGDSAGIDRQVKALASSKQSLYRLDERALFEAKPDVIVTQDICHVCAVTPNELERAIGSLPHRPRVLTLGPQSLSDVIEDVERIGAALSADARGKDLARALRSRVAAVRAEASGRPSPGVACLEWLNPLYIGGHWVPEIVHIAGGHDVLGRSGQPSREVTMADVRAAAPDIVTFMPCGFSLERTVSELTALHRSDPAGWRSLTSSTKTYAVDAGSYFSRPGPRLVDGLELMADICAGRVQAGRRSDRVRDLTGSAFLTDQHL
jgi:iron complex transport system substrate-binding protein